MKETKFKQTLVQTKEGSRHCEEHSDVAIQGGFKMTEVGMIPSDWGVKTIKDLGVFLGGGTPSTKNESFWKGNIPWISSADLNDDDIEHISTTRFITQEAVNCSATQICPQGTILIIARVGVGKLALSQQKVCTSQDFCNLIPSKENDSKFLAYALLPVMKQMANESQGTSIKGIAVDEIKKVQIIVPYSKAEQTAIANALSDVDTLIANLEKLIAKKKNIKQGAMQQLLTGKKRLPGFGSDNGHTDWFTPNGVHEKSIKTAKVVRPESIRVKDKEQCAGFKMTELGLIPTDWENVNISKTCTIKARIGWQGLKSTEYLNSGDYILVTGTDFKNGFIDWSTCSYVSEWRFKQDKNIQIKKGDVLVTKDGTIGKVAFLNEIPMEGTLNSGVFVVRSKDLKKIDSVYLSLVFKSSWFDNFLDEITSGSTIVHLYQKDFVKFNFPIPSSIEEQTAIANVLSDMDAEISALETKLAKYRTLKTGMMQQLLTGKIRLV